MPYFGLSIKLMQFQILTSTKLKTNLYNFLLIILVLKIHKFSKEISYKLQINLYISNSQQNITLNSSNLNRKIFKE